MQRATTPYPQPVKAKAADPPPEPDTCDGCPHRSTCGTELEPELRQGRLFDAEPGTYTPTNH